jgi:hypothetical protein
MKPHIFKRNGKWSVFIPALGWMTTGCVATGTFADVAREAVGYWRCEADRLARASH